MHKGRTICQHLHNCYNSSTYTVGKRYGNLKQIYIIMEFRKGSMIAFQTSTVLHNIVLNKIEVFTTYLH